MSNNFSTMELCNKLWIGLVTTMTKHYQDNGDILIRNSDIKECNLIESGIYLNKNFSDQHESRKLQENDVVTVHTGDVGTSAKISNKFIGSHGFATINSRLKTELIDPDYYCRYLNSRFFKQQIYQVITGDGRDNLNLNDFAKLKVFVPDLSTQKRIAKILSTVDGQIEKTEAIIAKYQAIKQGMLRDLFTRGIDLTTGKLRPIPEQAPELYKSSPLGLIPKDWDIVNISEISYLVTNGFVGIATPYYTNKSDGVKYLFGTNIRANLVDYNNMRYISKHFHNSHIKSQLRSGDLLMVQSGHIGTCSVIPENFGEANCHALIIVKLNKEIINPCFVSYYLNSDSGQNNLESIKIGSTIKHINTSDLATHNIKITSLIEQNIIVQKIQNALNQIELEIKNLRKLQKLKQGLMSKLLKGDA